jgi:signal transduction histidine kinase
MGHVAATFYVYFLYQSVLSRRVIDLVELLGKAAVLGVLTLVLATVYALLLLWVGTHEQELWLFNTLVASFVILILYDQVRPWVEATTARLLFRQRFELLRVIRRLQRDLRTTISIEEMTRQVIDAVHSSGRVNQVALYLSTEAEIEYELAGSQGVEPPQALSLRQQPTLLQELRRERRPILLETLIDRYEDQPAMITEGDPTAQRDLNRAGEAIATMRALGAQAVLPILSEDDILGVLTLGTEHPTESFSTEELAALLSLADACAVVIENSQEYERLRERDRLVAVGEMAAGIAHEIRNPLGAIKGAAQCLDTGTLPQEATEFIDVIVEETDRLSRVLGQFLEYARPYRGNPVPTDVNEVITATLRLLTPDAIPDHIVICRNLAHDLHKVSVDPEQLKQVLINLTLNAVHAMPDGGELSVSTATSHDATGEHRDEVRGLKHVHTVISIHDTGPGIPSDDLPRVFLPFFTTKTNGTGLGLAISDRIVRNAGGRIDVTSHIGHGTTFTIRLPIATASK